MSDRPASRLRIEPLDPDSPKGRQVAEALSEVFADIRLRIARDKAVAVARRVGEPPADVIEPRR